MPINYVVTKKIDKSRGTPRELYYASTKALQNKPVNSRQIAEELAARSSLQNGDAISVLVQLSDIIADHLKEGRTVSIDGLGNFFPSITSEGVETPEECTATKVKLSRICFKASPFLIRKVQKTSFISLQLKYTQDENGLPIQRASLKRREKRKAEAEQEKQEEGEE